jgi:hypothetical protein
MGLRASYLSDFEVSFVSILQIEKYVKFEFELLKPSIFMEKDGLSGLTHLLQQLSFQTPLLDG